MQIGRIQLLLVYRCYFLTRCYLRTLFDCIELHITRILRIYWEYASLSSGQFPTVFRRAVITPLLKQPGMDINYLGVTGWPQTCRFCSSWLNVWCPPSGRHTSTCMQGGNYQIWSGGSDSPQPMNKHNSIAIQNRISDCRAHETASFSHHYQYFLSFFIN